MKEVRGQSTAVVAAPLHECVSLLEAVDRYPEWHPEVVREVEVLERDSDGRPARVRAMLHAARGPLVKDVEVDLAMTVDPDGTVKLTRVPNEPLDEEEFEVTWRLQGGRHTLIQLELAAKLDVPRLLPLGGIGDWLAHGFVSAALRELRAERGAPRSERGAGDQPPATRKSTG